MESLFGVPMGTLMVIFLIAFVVVVGVVAALALRNRVLLRLALRGIPRRRGRTILIVLGLMLGTLIISAAFGTGDTMTHTIRSTVLTSLGNIDDVISVKGADTGSAFFVQAEADIEYFDEALFAQVEAEIGGSELVDGLAPVIIEPVAVQDRTSQQNEPRVTLFAIDPAHIDGFGEIKQVGGGTVSLTALAEGEVYLNDVAADELNASAGDELLAFAAERIIELRVKAVVKYQGGGTDEAGMLMALDAAQSLLGKGGQIKHIMVSNQGGALSGVKHTDAVIASLQPVLDPLGLEADPTKEDALDFANELGTVFTSFFITFGTFSIAAGIMLILLIFVMLAAERKPEMGMARAVGTKRRHLVEMFLFEGMVYDLLAAGVGAVLGLAVAFGMVLLMAKAFATFGVDIQHDFRLRSLIVAYTMGMLLTFIVVTVSAWRVSVLNIVTAIRDLPDPLILRGPEWKRGRRWAIAGILLAHLYVPMSILAFVLSGARLGGLGAWLRRQRPPATWFLGVAGVELGVILTISGLSARHATLFGMGISFLIMALVPLLRRLGAPDRVAFTLPGILLLTWWLRPFDSLDFILPDMSSDVSIFLHHLGDHVSHRRHLDTDV